GQPAPGYDQTYNVGNCDAFVVKLNSSGAQLLYSTYLGGTDGDYGCAIAIGDDNNAYVAGFTNSSDFPMTQTVGGTQAPGYDQTYNGGNLDAFVVKLSMSCPELYVEATPNKSSYFYRDNVLVNIVLRNLGGLATGSKLDIEIPTEISYVSCNDYRVIVSGQNLSINIGDIEQDEVVTFAIKLEVSTDIHIQKKVPIIFDLTASECDACDRKIVSIVLAQPYCPELYVEATPNKSSYFYRDNVLVNIVLRNLGGLATGSKLDIEIPTEISYVSCNDYRVIVSGQNLSINIGDIEQDEVIKFVILLEVIKDVLLKKSAPIILELKANECDSYATRIINILLKPQRTSKQDFDLSVRLLNLEFDDVTGKYYLPFDQTLEMLMKVCGCQDHYSCCIQWGDGECTNKEEKEPFIVKKHKFTAKGVMNIKVKVQDTNGREKTSAILLNVR
ncbi:MAG: SBBP repeat-containing protein, partial [Caldisericia bacterium]|nr:SBBP repeat-containing protein [Caldisericia bacterium]